MWKSVSGTQSPIIKGVFMKIREDNAYKVHSTVSSIQQILKNVTSYYQEKKKNP